MNEIKLLNAERSKDCRIKRIEIEDEKMLRHLKTLGFLEYELISINQSNFGKGAYLVKVMGITYALDKTICEKIFVECIT